VGEDCGIGVLFAEFKSAGEVVPEVNFFDLVADPALPGLL